MTTDADAIRALVAHYAAAWNRGDGTDYGSVFADDADFTSIRLDRAHGRAAIAAGHQAIFDTIYRGTRLEAEVAKLRFLRPDIAVVEIDQRLFLPDGSAARGLGGNAGNTTHILGVAERRPEGWRFVAFQNMVPVASAAADRALREVPRG